MNKFIITLTMVIVGLTLASSSSAATYSINPGSAGSLCTGNYVGRACAPSTQTNINIPQAGHYSVLVRVNRGNNIIKYECQAKESFYMSINGQRTPIVRDPDSCEWSGTIKTQEVSGDYYLKQGNNTIQLFHAHAGEAGVGIESLGIESIIFQSIPEDGICGGANGGIFDTAPTAGLCEKGTFTGVATTGTWWIWSCEGINGGSSDSCRARVNIVEERPICGSANGGVFDTAPTTNLCSVGNSVRFGGAGPWNWSCSNDGYFVECNADITAAPICGSSHNQTFSAAPTTGLCSVGNASSIGGSGPWNWDCTSGVRSVECNANYAETAIQIIKSSVDGNDLQTIESGADASFTITVTNTGEENLRGVVIDDDEAPNCSKSASQTQELYSGNLLDPNETFTYTCVDNNVTNAYTNIATVEAYATTSTVTVQDRDSSEIVIRNLEAPGCGSSNGQTLDTAPTTGLCSVGTASVVSGSGPWNWSCANNEQVVDCNASLTSNPQPEPGPSPIEPEEDEEENDDGAIGNFVWHDRNANGVQDEGEEGIVGVKLKLYNGNDVETDRTNSRGRYKFKDLKSGQYRVVVAQETLPEGCYQTYDKDGKLDNKIKTRIDEGQYYRKADFGYKCPSGEVVTKTSPQTGSGTVAIIVSLVVAGLSSGYVYRRNLQKNI